MSFSNDVRNELARVMPERQCCRKAELSALLVNAQLAGVNNGFILRTETENAAIARKQFKLIKDIYGWQSSVRMETRTRFKKHRVYVVSSFLDQEGIKALQELLVIDQELQIRQQACPAFITRNCCRRSFLRGLFLNRGFISRPEESYHLEILVNGTGLAADAQKMASRMGLELRGSARKNSIMLYMKDSEGIADFLRLAGANIALLDYENVRIIKSMRNNVNRQVNCETANLAKTIDASVRQIELIKQLKAAKGLEILPVQLKELAILRIEYPDCTLKELGNMLTPALSKSGVAYRMRKLESAAEEILQQGN